LFLKIKLLDQNSLPGKLNVGDGLRTIKGKLLLKEFVFTPKVGIRQQFGNPQVNESDFSLVWQDFDPSSIKFPKGATHFELLYLVLAYKNANKIFTTYSSTPIRRSKTDKTEILELQTKLPIIKEDGVLYISTLGLRYIEILGNEEYNLLGKDAIGIEIMGVW